ncbi:alpha/beta-hydrolase family protein [Dietzia sp.]|uniref:alpha/beta-hydrolase family protein n=1 Tax=Dietzia sp. TaxID=1871616 RepID=UPI002FD95F71
MGILAVIAGFYFLGSSLSGLAWWAFDSGPLRQSPELVLQDPSPLGAVRTYVDTPGADPAVAAGEAVDRLDVSGGFDRQVLVIALPTGSGWVDPDEADALERWAGGDIATVAVRYSRAPSAAVFVLDPARAVNSARALISGVTEHIAAMPENQRPKLVVQGESLGAQSGAAALADPALAGRVDAVLWQGRPGEDAHPYAAPAGLPNSCAVSALNPGDPVGSVSWGLLRDPARAAGVLAALPGSESAAPGTEHSYDPIVPPAECVPVPRVSASTANP